MSFERGNVILRSMATHQQRMTTKGKGWLRLSAAADHLGVSENTLRRWADGGKVPVFRTAGGQRRFRRADIERFLETSAAETHARPSSLPVPRRRPPRVDEAAVLLDTSRAVATAPTLDEALASVARQAALTLGADGCAVYEHDEVQGVLVARALVGTMSCQGDHAQEPLALASHPHERRVMLSGGIHIQSRSDVQLDRASRAFLDGRGATARLCVPLRLGGESAGLLVACRRGDAASFDPEKAELALKLGEVAAAAINQARLVRRLEDRNRHLAALVRAGRAMSSTVELERVLCEVAEQATQALHAERCVIWEYDAERDGIYERAYVSNDPDDPCWPRAFANLEEDPVSRDVLTSGIPLQESVSDADLHPASRTSMERYGEKTCLSVPLICDGEPMGMLVLIEATRERDYTEAERDLALAIAEQAASAINNAKRFSHQEEQTRRLAILLDASRAVTSSVADDDLLSSLARRTADALGCPECALWRYDWGSSSLAIAARYPEFDTLQRLRVRRIQLEEWPAAAELLDGGPPLVETVGDAALDETVRCSMDRALQKTRLSLPLRCGEQALGVLVLAQTERERVFTAAEVDLARGLSEHAAVALHNARLIEHLELRGHEATLLNEIAKRTATSLHLRDIAAATLDELRRLTRFDRASLVVRQPSGQFDAVFATDPSGRVDALGLEALGAEFEDRLVAERVVLRDLPGDSPLACEHAGFGGLRSTAAIALFEEGRVVGALILGSETPSAFRESDRRIFEGVGTHLSLAVKNARLYDSIKRLHVGSLCALSSALNAKDYYTLGHTARVAAYAVLLAAELGWDRDLIDRVEEAAYLHDIGKISVSDRILLKPGRLSEEDWRLMREHPVVSAEILKPLLQDALVGGIRHHHERFDGDGYPDALVGGRIPPLARLLCVVDSYDAMSSRRLYRPPHPYDSCLDELRRCRGSQFDPRMVNAFLRVLERLRVVKDRAAAAAAAAARRIDAAEHMELRQAGDEQRPEYGRIAAALRETLAAYPEVRRLRTEARRDEHRMMVVVDVCDDPATELGLGETLLADEEQAQALGGLWLDSNVVHIDSSGAWICGRAPIVSDDDRVVGLVSAGVPATVVQGAPSDMARSISDLVQSAASRLTRLEIDAMTDFLSGLYNHRYFQDRLGEEIVQARAAGEQLSLLFCDIDHFKDYNDRHGHTAGDAALRAVAQVIERCIRTADIAARYGGDEFAVILVGTGKEVALAVAERIRACARALRLEVGGSHVAVSIGVATLPGDARDREELVESADRAMYLAKRWGRDRVVALSLGGDADAEGVPVAGSALAGMPLAAGFARGGPLPFQAPDGPPAASRVFAEFADAWSPASDRSHLAADHFIASVAAELGLLPADVQEAIGKALGGLPPR